MTPFTGRSIALAHVDFRVALGAGDAEFGPGLVGMVVLSKALGEYGVWYEC